jgi:diacylglycerol kinase family enzyme
VAIGHRDCRLRGVRVLLLHNPTAGDDSPTADDLVGILRRAGFSVDYLPTDDPALQRRLTDPVDLLAVAGGDGTVAVVLAQLDGGTAPLTILPLGTANNLARALGIAADDGLPALVAGLRQGRQVPLKFGQSSGPWGRQRFFESAGFGAIARALGPVNASKVPSAEKIPQGRRAMKQVFRELRPARLAISLDGRRTEEELLMLELTRIASIGPKLCIAPPADPGDDFLHVACLPTSSRAKMVEWLDDPESGPAPLLLRKARRVEVQWRDTPSHLDDYFHDAPAQPCTMQAWLASLAVDVLVPGRQAA